MNLVPSLEEMTVIKISSILWNQSDVRALTEKCPKCVDAQEEKVDLVYLTPLSGLERFRLCPGCIDGKNEEKRGKIIEKVLENVQKLPLPELLQQNVSGFVGLMGRQIFDEPKVLFRREYGYFYRTLRIPVTPDKYPWTPNGRIDRKKMMKTLIEDESVDPATRYNLAHIYCFEGDVQNIWESIPETCKKYICQYKWNPGVINQQDLVFFWTYLDHNPNLSFNERVGYNRGSIARAFRNAVGSENKIAAEYFFQFLTPREKEKHLVPAARKLPNAEVLCFLLSQMDDEQLMEVLQGKPHKAMLKIFNSSFMSFAVETANRTGDSPSAYNIRLHTLIALINSKVRRHCGDGTYRHLFMKLWKDGCQRFGADVFCHPLLLRKLFLVKDKESIEFIFRVQTVSQPSECQLFVSPAKKKNIILSDVGLQISRELTQKGEGELLEFFIRECLSSESEIRQYRKKVNPFFPEYVSAWKRRK